MRKVTLLSSAQRRDLNEARRSDEYVIIKTYERRVTPQLLGRYRRLQKIEAMEQAISRFLSDIDRNGSMPCDHAAITKAKLILDDASEK